MLPTTEAFLGASLVLQLVFLVLTLRERHEISTKESRRGMTVLACLELIFVLFTIATIGFELDRPKTEPIPMGDSHVRR